MMVFFAFFGFLAFGDTGGQEEIGYLLFFPNSSNSFVNHAQAMTQLDNIAKNLMERNLLAGQINVFGYTAIAANYIKPMDLSRDRAVFVMNELQRRGVPGELFSEPVCQGEVALWGDNTTEASKSPNRRVRVLLDNNILPPAAPVVPPVIAPVIESAATVATATPATAADKSRSGFPWKILLPLIGLIILAAIIFFLLKCRKSSTCCKAAVETPPSSAPTPITPAPSAELAAASGAGVQSAVLAAAAVATGAVATGTVDNANDAVSIKNSKHIALENGILAIISSVPFGAYFDVHTVVQILLQQYDDVYLTNIGNYKSAAQYHSKISSIIGHHTDLVEVAGNSYSKNIHDKFSECHLFRRKR